VEQQASALDAARKAISAQLHVAWERFNRESNPAKTPGP
jgi:hypothetical protein